MRNQDFHDELKDMFAEQDAALDDAHFSSRLMSKIGRRRLLRRSVFALAMAIGLLVAAPQLPSLLSMFAGIEGASGLSVDAVEQTVREMAGVNPYWLFAGLVCVLSVLATFAMERV